MRLAIVLVAVVAWLGSAWADVNGRNYDWWTWSLRALALLTLAAAFVPAPRIPPRPAAAALLIAVASVVVTTQHFNDSYGGSRAWPDALAVVFAVGCAVGVGYLSSESRRRRGGRATAR